MEVGTIFYIEKGEYEARGSDEEFHRYAVGGSTADGRGWLCYSETGPNGIVNKRSRLFREGIENPFGKAKKAIYQPVKDDMEFAWKHRRKIAYAVEHCDPHVLRRVASVVGYDGGDTDG